LVKGESRTYHQNGQLSTLDYWHGGERDGPYKDWHENGLIWEKSFRVKGLTTGLCSIWGNTLIPAFLSYWIPDLLMLRASGYHSISFRNYMALLYFKDRLRKHLRNKIVEQCQDPCYRMPLIPSHIVAGYCI
jgi:antitoxin component YwqK of YwqJK toxin-antitoxin module